MRLPFTIANRAIQGNFDALLSALGGNRIVRGIVASGGTVIKGTGFTSAKTGTGLYTVTFTTPFPDVPAVVLTTQPGAGQVAVLGSAVAGSFGAVTLVTNTAVLSDSQFHFIAIGP